MKNKERQELFSRILKDLQKIDSELAAAALASVEANICPCYSIQKNSHVKIAILILRLNHFEIKCQKCGKIMYLEEP